jgi:hypothetical protein
MPVDEIPGDIVALEAAAAAHLDSEAGAVEADLDASAESAPEEPETTPVPTHTLRTALAVSTSVLGAAVMAGGIFNGITPRLYAAVAGMLGVGLAVLVARVRRTWMVVLLVAAGLFLVGVVAVLPSGIDAVANLQVLVSKAAASTKNIRPPIDMTPGWTAVVAWIMAAFGFAATWVGVAVRRPSIAVLVPLPLAGLAAISVPKGEEQLISGLLVFVLFAAGLGILAGIRSAGTEDSLPVGYEIRRALKALPVMAVITGGMFWMATQTTFLFPRPLVDPELSPQKPKTVPLTQVPDRVLFEVKSGVTGPWVLGTLDVYDASDGTWRLPPFADNAKSLAAVPSDGVVNRALKPEITADITVRALEGAILPGLPNTVVVQASGPKLSFDGRSGNIRITQGQLEPGFHYRIASPGVPAVADLRKDDPRVRADLVQFTQMPEPPPAVKALLAQAPKTSKWDEFDFLRNYVLQNVTAVGQGAPVPVTVERTQAILSADQKEGSPFEIVALQVMLARWAGVPARIGYGFDGGDKVGEVLQVHPTNGAAFPEVYFANYQWLPVIGTPLKAKTSQASDPRFQQKRTDILPSNDINVPIFLPDVEPSESLLFDQLRGYFFSGLLVAVLLAVLYLLFPIAHKAVRRGLRRAAASGAGPRARLIQAYAEWRDHATDYGYRHPSDTPLLFLDRFVPDEEHSELAWLVTRALWGDLRGGVDEELADDAEEYSQTLRRRLSMAQPLSVRASAALSRLSLREPFDTRSRQTIHEEVQHGAPAPA